MGFSCLQRQLIYSSGSEFLLEILGLSVVLFLSILGVLPDAMVSGFSGDVSTAQSQAYVGMGLLAALPSCYFLSISFSSYQSLLS
ncbi:hypothetical protein Bca4012_060300 [Brassica carinata]